MNTKNDGGVITVFIAAVVAVVTVVAVITVFLLSSAKNERTSQNVAKSRFAQNRS